MKDAFVVDLKRTAVRNWAGARYVLRHAHPARLLLGGYISYVLLGWCMLSLPWAQAVPVLPIDNLFMAASAVSTTGLATVDTGTSYTLFGEVVLLMLIQLGGLGYMTIGSFAVMALAHDIGPLRRTTARAAFNLPDGIDISSFLASVLVFTLVTELVGAVALYAAFAERGTPDPLWNAIFHSVSAFCTAGFSLFPNSFEDFRTDIPVNATLSVLSILGAIGFIILVDTWRRLTGRPRRLGFTSTVIARMTAVFLICGTLIVFVAEPAISQLGAGDRLMTAFFQTMSASTTVGFDTYPIGSLSAATMVLLLFLMAIGASPAGTGGGLKTTTFAVLLALVRSTLRGRSRIQFFGRKVRQVRIQAASAALAYFFGLLLVASFLLMLTEQGAEFEKILFEAISAMGTVGLSMGLTGDLSYLGKVIIVVLMMAGRVGFITFGIALAGTGETREPQTDNDLVL